MKDKLLSLVMIVMMALSLVPIPAFATMTTDDTITIESNNQTSNVKEAKEVRDSSSDSKSVNTYLSKLIISENYNEDTNLLDNPNEDNTYSIQTSITVSNLYFKTKLSKSAPEDSKIQVTYFENNVEKTQELEEGDGYIGQLFTVGKWTSQNIIKITVGAGDDVQEYTVNVNRMPVILYNTVTDMNGNEFINFDDNYLVPEGTESINLKIHCYDAKLTINGENATSKENYALKPVFEDGVFKVTVKAFYDENHMITQIYNFKEFKKGDTFSGEFNKLLKWSLTDGVLTISGKGDMSDYSKSTKPPYDVFKDSIKAVVFEDGVTSVGAYTFYGYDSLENVTFSDTVKSVGNYAFSKTSIKNIVLPKTIEAFGNNVFEECKNIQSATIESPTMGKLMFNKCIALKDVIISDSVTTISDTAFANCTSIEKVSIPSSVKTIERAAFTKCSNLKIIELSEGLTTIEGYAFEGTAIETIAIPSTATDIDFAYAFSSCNNLKEIKVTGVNFKSDNGIIYTADGKKAVYCSKDYVGSVNILEGTEVISANVFQGCEGIKAVTIPEGLTTIELFAFEGCNSLTKINLPESLKTIDNYAFKDCTSLEEISIPSNITKISSGCFNNCASLKNIEIPEGVTNIEQYAFIKCASLTKVKLPKSLKSIGSGAFSNCSSLKKLEIPEGITIISSSLINNCTSLESIVIPKSVTVIQYSAFNNTNKTLKAIYYRGSEEEWNTIEGEKPSNPKWSATIVYNYLENIVTFDADNGSQNIIKAVNKDGKIDYTSEVPTKEGYTFVGWYKDIDDITTTYKSDTTYTESVTYKAKWAHVSMLGAQGKLVVDSRSGIRFGTKLYTDGDEIVEKGTLIIPSNLLGEGEALTLENKKAAKSIGKIIYDENKEEHYITYLGTLINIPKVQFETQITAASYVIYKDKAGNQYTVYSQYPNGSISVYDILGNNIKWNEQW